jgi:hypothetical protein
MRELAAEHPLHQRLLHLAEERLDNLRRLRIADQRIQRGGIEGRLRCRRLFSPF